MLPRLAGLHFPRLLSLDLFSDLHLPIPLSLDLPLVPFPAAKTRPRALILLLGISNFY